MNCKSPSGVEVPEEINKCMFEMAEWINKSGYAPEVLFNSMLSMLLTVAVHSAFPPNNLREAIEDAVGVYEKNFDNLTNQENESGN